MTIINILKNNKLCDEYNVIKELEETIIDLYDKTKSSEIFNNELLFLVPIEQDNNYNIKL